MILELQRNRFDLGDFERIPKLGRKKKRKKTKYIMEKIYMYC